MYADVRILYIRTDVPFRNSLKVGGTIVGRYVYTHSWMKGSGRGHAAARRGS